MTNTDPRREAVRHVDQQIELCSRSYASARVARDPEGMALVRARYLDLEIKNREAEADYLQAETTQPRPIPHSGWGLRCCQHDHSLRRRIPPRVRNVRPRTHAALCRAR